MQPIQCFHKLAAARERKFGRVIRLTSSEFWAEVRSEWTNVAPDDPFVQEAFKQAEESVAKAVIIRAQRRAAADTPAPILDDGASADTEPGVSSSLTSVPITSAIMLSLAPSLEQCRDCKNCFAVDNVRGVLESKWPVSISGMEGSDKEETNYVWDRVAAAGPADSFGKVPQPDAQCCDVCQTKLGPHGALLQALLLKRTEATLRQASIRKRCSTL